VTGCIKGLIDGLSLEFERARQFISDLRREFVPDTAVNLIEEWYLTLGLPYNSTLTLSDLQNKAKAVDTAVGGQDIVYLQGQVDAAAIDVTICELTYPNETRVGNSECRVGVAYCQGNVISVLSSASGVVGISRVGLARVGGEIPVNPVLFHFLVKGDVKNREERDQLYALIQCLAPGHLVPVYDLTLLSDFARVGVAIVGISRVGLDS
jgi:hypothetical protein